MTFDILTLFPEAVETMLGISIIGRARKAGLLSVNCHQIRDFTEDKHRNVDDTPAGGGMGMVMAAQPIYDCYRHAVADAPEGERRRVIYLSPRGQHLTHALAAELSACDRLVLLCGHYEGVDQRVLDEMGAEEISIGDYILTGGELPAGISSVMPRYPARHCRTRYTRPSRSMGRTHTAPGCRTTSLRAVLPFGRRTSDTSTRKMGPSNTVSVCSVTSASAFSRSSMFCLSFCPRALPLPSPYPPGLPLLSPRVPATLSPGPGFRFPACAGSFFYSSTAGGGASTAPAPFPAKFRRRRFALAKSGKTCYNKEKRQSAKENK